MMKTIIVLIVFVFCYGAFKAYAEDLPELGEPKQERFELTKGQIAAETAFLALMYTDYRQTLGIKDRCARNPTWANKDGTVTRQPDGSYTDGKGGYCRAAEANPLLGKHPSDQRITNYFLGASLAHVLITKALPNEYRPYWLGTSILLQLIVVGKNRQIGGSFNF